MRKCISCLLAICTLWMSTWLVTDIHDVAAADRNQPHPIFSAQLEPTDSDLEADFNIESPQCEICSYDHGGHVGQTLIISQLTSKPFDCQHTYPTCYISSYWKYRNRLFIIGANGHGRRRFWCSNGARYVDNWETRKPSRHELPFQWQLCFSSMRRLWINRVDLFLFYLSLKFTSFTHR